MYKAPWVSLDNTTENQVDHIYINNKFTRSIKEARIKKGADIAPDHHLVVAKMKLKLKNHWTPGETALQKFNTAFLRNTDKFNEFKIAFSFRFQALQDLLEDDKTTIDDNWKRLEEALTSTCQEVLVLKKYYHMVRISMKNLRNI
ncbi:unnamed protein product [Schistosoma mattheei]|uniref:Uncharacterized protein n=1 Tax=Schistosoma mattheei TaxID=31246 RepID=A0A183PPF3_9TREM|nr:unnamed protein product [Schistosoma mattheei]